MNVWTANLGRYILRHPSVTPTLARAGWRMRRRGWWHQRPFLPMPDPAYWRFRMVTANGDTGPALRPQDLVDAAKWALRQPTPGH